MVNSACPRCLMPYQAHAVEVAQLESILLSMYAMPATINAHGPAIQILTHLAPTCDDVERVRTALHGIDIQALADRNREVKLRLHTQRYPPEVEARLHNMLRDAESGLLRWRIDHLCRTACAASEARAKHHRKILESTP